MKHQIATILFLLCVPFWGVAQINLVHNPSFEDHTSCPTTYDQVAYANFWNGIDTPVCFTQCAPDYCNVCGSGQVAVPHGGTANYFHYPRTGNGMMQMQLYYDYGSGGHIQDYLQGKLYTNLVAGKSYCVTFYVVNMRRSEYAINHIGSYLDDGTIDTTTHCNYYQTEYSPQIVETPVISDTINWTKIQGSFIANGTEKFITIGNFFDTSGTTHVQVNYTPHSQVGEYLIDDVSVIALDDTANAGPDRMTSPTGDSVWVGDSTGYLPCYWYANGVLIDSNTAGLKVHPDTTTAYIMVLDVCGHITSDTAVVWVYPLGESGVRGAVERRVRVWPNPATDVVNITGAGGCEVRVYDMVGQMCGIECTWLDKPTMAIHFTQLPKGVYTVAITDPVSGERVVRKVVKN